MGKRMFLSYLAIILVCLLGAYFAIWNQGYHYMQKQSEEAFLNQAFMLADELEEQTFKTDQELKNYILRKAKKFDFRITLMDQSGKVLVDSSHNSKTMENHSSREEFQEARLKGSSSAVHYSEILNADCHYGAVSFENQQFHGVLRLSTPISSYQELWKQVLAVMFMLLIAGVVVAILLALFFTRKMIAPIESITEAAEEIAKGNYGAIIQTKDRAQIGRLANSFNHMSANLKDNMERLNSRNLELENFSEMRKEFVSNVTHELKTPLTSIRGFIDTLKNGALEDPEYAEHFLDIIDIEAERLGKLIQDILILSEMESKDTKLYTEELTKCDLMVLWKEVEELLYGRQKKGVKLEGDFDKNIPFFYGNPFHLKEILLNLTDNALTYTESGFVKVSCTKEENNLKIQVKDTGIGISEEHLSRLFERFYRVDKGRSRKQGGTGLGLSIVKHIVELYDGKIEVKSKVGSGSCFDVYLPYKDRMKKSIVENACQSDKNIVS